MRIVSRLPSYPEILTDRFGYWLGDNAALSKRVDRALFSYETLKNPAAVRELIDKGANPNTFGGGLAPALVRACESLSVDSVRILLAAGADVNLFSRGRLFEDNPLTAACRQFKHLGFSPQESRKCLELVQLLLAAGADINAADSKGGRSVLHRCCSPGNRALLVLLLERGADPNARDKKNATPLHDVVRAGNLSTPASYMDLLVRYGADVNAQDGAGRTALHCVLDPNTNAVTGVSIEHLQQLLYLGADLDIANSSGTTARDWLDHYGDTVTEAVRVVERAADVESGLSHTPSSPSTPSL